MSTTGLIKGDESMRGHDAQNELAEAELNVVRARAAVASEQREADKAAYRLARQQGRALLAEYNAVRERYSKVEAEIRLKTLPFEALNDEMKLHIGADPALVDDFASDEALEAWKARGIELVSEHRRLVTELNQLYAKREPLKMEAIRLGEQLDHSKFVVRNLKDKLSDSNSEYARQGGTKSWMFFGGEVNQI
jgi:hypothetical protein